MNDLCAACEHVYDEHDDGGKDCLVEGCDCILFEPDYSDDD